MKKRLITVMALLLVLTLSVSATEMLALFSRTVTTLSFTGTTAKCKVTASCDSDVESITAEVTLYYVSSSGTQLVSYSWPEETVNGNNYSFLKYVSSRTSGATYVLEAVLTAVDGSGNEETVVITDECEC